MSGNLECLSLIIKGRIPSKKNSRVQFYNKHLGRTINIPSADYTQWHKSASAQLLLQNARNIMLHDIVLITLNFFFPDNRRADLTNKAESIMDLLVDNKVIPDDNWKTTGRILLIPKGINKTNPHCEINIEHYKGLL
jgi:Holliday junction resolvase RusA-like endonuclease